MILTRRNRLARRLQADYSWPSMLHEAFRQRRDWTEIRMILDAAIERGEEKQALNVITSQLTQSLYALAKRIHFTHFPTLIDYNPANSIVGTLIDDTEEALDKTALSSDPDVYIQSAKRQIQKIADFCQREGLDYTQSIINHSRSVTELIKQQAKYWAELSKAVQQLAVTPTI